MRVMNPDREELLARRERLLRQARTSREELEARADRGTLTGDEYWLWEDIRSVEFLLREDEATGEREVERA